jgi:toxin FitB
MIVLDTNVFSALMQVAPDASVVAWLNRQPRTSVWITSVTVFEIRFGLQIMASGKRRTALLQSFESLLERIEHRVASFDDAAADHAADLMASRQNAGRPGDLRDTMIAGIVVARQAAIATRNITHFADISATVLNPWKA